MLRKFCPVAAALLLSLGSVPADAHHSNAMFDTAKEMTLSGTVKQFQWTNPHCYIQMMVEDGSGKMVEWSMELGAPMYLYRNGWRPGTLKPGTKVSVTFNPLRNGKPGGVVITVRDANGKPFGTEG